VTSRLTWLGHATVLLELAGVRLITDPVLRRRVGHLFRQTPVPDAGGPVDGVLLSHLHRDHVDLPSLRRLDPRAAIVAPAGARRALRRLGREVIELELGGRTRIGPVQVHAVPAVHQVRRTPLGETTGAVGYVVETGRRIYFAGDTERFDGMAALAPIDVALLPVWGWGPTLGPGHMDPGEAASAAALIRPAVAVPIHWGTYLPAGTAGRHADLLRDPPQHFADEVGRVAPDTRVAILAPGGVLELDPVAT
jgi:L-ascorbate metabolism protein UlaG (beta-lactamase superfamily)